MQRRFLKKMAKGFIMIPDRLLARLPEGRKIISRKIMLEMQLLEKKGTDYISMLKRPKKESHMALIEKSNEINEETAIVMQGQLVSEDDFTVETVKIYKKLFPGVTVIVSTWTADDRNIIERLKRIDGCKVVLSEYPEYSGLLNVNYQVITTLAGIREAKKLGLKYVFKTRCDYRFYKKGLPAFLYSLLMEYPPDSSVKYQQYRIIAGGEVRDSMFRPFWLADQFNFGYVEDMYSYWNYTLKPINIGKKEVHDLIASRHLSWNDRTREHLAAEPDIVLDFLLRNEGKIPSCTVKKFWDVIKKQFIVVSREDLGYFWVKYDSRYDEAVSNGTYYDDDSVNFCFNYNWDFMQWFLLYKGLLPYREEYESFSENNRY